MSRALALKVLREMRAAIGQPWTYGEEWHAEFARRFCEEQAKQATSFSGVTQQSLALDEVHNLILWLKETLNHNEGDVTIISLRMIEAALVEVTTPKYWMVHDLSLPHCGPILVNHKDKLKYFANEREWKIEALCVLSSAKVPDKNEVAQCAEDVKRIRADILAEPISDTAMLDFLEHSAECHIATDYEDGFVTLDRVEGNINDREYREVGRGNTLREAIAAALKLGERKEG